MFECVTCGKTNSLFQVCLVPHELSRLAGDARCESCAGPDFVSETVIQKKVLIHFDFETRRAWLSQCGSAHWIKVAFASCLDCLTFNQVSSCSSVRRLQSAKWSL
jgi:hypothetical protein